MSKYDYQKIASEYDEMVKQYEWHGPELIYDHLSKVVRKGTKLLDIGVGTGISSERFYENQVELYGLDNSSELIEVCKSKNVFKEVQLFDIEKDQIPYPDSMFDFLVCSGVLHFFSDLEKIFEQVSKVLKSNGFFVFTIIENRINDNPINSLSANGVSVYHHSREYIKSMEEEFNFSRAHEHKFNSIKDLDTGDTLEFTLIVLRREN